MLYNKIQLINLLLENIQAQPKAKYSNNVLIQMLECLPNEFTCNIEPTRNGFAVNRGSLAECIIKAVVYDSYSVDKSSCLSADLNTIGLSYESLELVNGVKSSNIEIKFSTSFAPATNKTSKARKTIIVCEYGIFMIDSKNIIPTKSGKININNQNDNDLTPLDNLMDRLGF